MSESSTESIVHRHSMQYWDEDVSISLYVLCELDVGKVLGVLSVRLKEKIQNTSKISIVLFWIWNS